MVLQTDTAGGKGAECFPFPEFAASDHFVPVIVPHFGGHYFGSIEEEFEGTVFGDDGSLVPLACGLYCFGCAGDEVVQVAGPVFDDFGIGMGCIVEYLHFGSGMVGFFNSRVFFYVEHDAAVAAGINLPFQGKVEVGIFFIGHEVAAAYCFTVFFFCGVEVKGAFHSFPGSAIRLVLKDMPVLFGGTVEE